MLVMTQQNAVVNLRQNAFQRVRTQPLAEIAVLAGHETQLVHDGHAHALLHVAQHEMIVVHAKHGLQRLGERRKRRVEVRIAALFHVLGQEGNERQADEILFRGTLGQMEFIVLPGDEQRLRREKLLKNAVRRLSGHARQAEIHAGTDHVVHGFVRQRTTNFNTNFRVFPTKCGNDAHRSCRKGQIAGNGDRSAQDSRRRADVRLHAAQKLEGGDGPREQSFTFRSNTQPFHVSIEQHCI